MKPKNFTDVVRYHTLANKSFNKIFCVGHNKTGTTTLEAVLKLYGYSLPSQAEQIARLSKNLHSTNYTELISFVSKFDAFQDMPFSAGINFVALDALFPNSKFILTIRDPDKWFQSLVNFHEKIYKVNTRNIDDKIIYEKYNYLYKGYLYENKKSFLTTVVNLKPVVKWDLLYDKNFYIEQYNNRNDLIIKYFRNANEKLFVLDITKEKDTKRLCDFLNIGSAFIINMPHLNKT